MAPPFTNLVFSSDAESSTTSIVHVASSRAAVSEGDGTAFTVGSGTPRSWQAGQSVLQQAAASAARQGRRQKLALLVDDDPQVARALALILGMSRMRLLTAVSPAKAAETLAVFGGEIAVMIARLGPAGHALELLAARRQAVHRAPVVVLKAAGDRGGWAAAIQAGATAFVDYPVDPAELQLVLMRVSC